MPPYQDIWHEDYVHIFPCDIQLNASEGYCSVRFIFYFNNVRYLYDIL